MKKNSFKALLLAGVLMTGGAVTGMSVLPVMARDIPVEWTVTFTSGGNMSSTFKSGEINQKVSEMQPGDRTKFEVTLKNEYGEATDWYMKNAVLSSLEESVKNASGGAYTYVLSYTDPSNQTKELFNSDTVGGTKEQAESADGLKEATVGREDWSYLYKLGTGASGKVQLDVALDGVTQGNNYQDTVADIMLEFGVEVMSPAPSPSVTPAPTTIPSTNTGKVGTLVKTGDDSRPLLYIILAGIAGVVLLVLAIFGLRSRKRIEAEANDQYTQGGRLQ
ncbi:MAG: sortase B protein-sorting domain-containing protein [Eubacterium sp.]|nr:sortase B protein-sorting domain-containing protein [Eubacterium sp.]